MSRKKRERARQREHYRYQHKLYREQQEIEQRVKVLNELRSRNLQTVGDAIERFGLELRLAGVEKELKRARVVEQLERDRQC